MITYNFSQFKNAIFINDISYFGGSSSTNYNIIYRFIKK